CWYSPIGRRLKEYSPSTNPTTHSIHSGKHSRKPSPLAFHHYSFRLLIVFPLLGKSVVGSRITKNPYPGSDNSIGWILLLA
ncbi:hypothetical protein LINPERPRIM_LOCUS23890, partial [Linum perenne]